MPAASRTDNKSGTKKRLLLIDDSKADGVILRRLVGRAYEFFHVLDEKDALTAVLDWQPDCVVVDYNLVESTGVEVLERLAHLESRRPVAYIILTGQESITIALDAMKNGAHDFLSKNSLDHDQLVKAIELAIRNASLAYQVKYLAYHDALTDLPNRKVFWQKLEERIVSFKVHGELFAVIYVDIDRFKAINDMYGHDIGDKVLVEVSRRIVWSIQGRDVVSRLGGDEFGIIVSDIADPRNVKMIADRIRNTLAKPFRIESKTLTVTASLGVSMDLVGEMSSDEIVHSSDLAMYRVKRNGGNNVITFDDDIRDEVRRQLAFEKTLGAALQRNEFLIYYQPIVNTAGRVVAVESLLRWHNPIHGMVSPIDFIPLLEETRQIVSVEHWVLTTVSEQHDEWQNLGVGSVQVHVNISPIQFQEDLLEQTIREILRRTEGSVGWLGIEITESTVVEDVSKCVRMINTLSEIDVDVSIDDFGTGYSSLSALARLPIQRLKIDRSFLHGVPSSPSDVSIAEAIIAMGKSLGLTVIAEGVENAEQVSFLKERSIDYYQGYLFGKPMPADQMTHLLLEQRDMA